jgi:hypothetical protein
MVNKLVLTQPGPVAEFIGYHIEFNLTPYPQLGKKIETGDYRLKLKVNKNED